MSADPTRRVIHRAFRYRLYPTPEQEAAFREWSGVCRLIYNLAWEQRRDFHRQYRRVTGRGISFFSQSVELKLLRAEHDWIAAVSTDPQLYALRDLDRAFSNFFAGRGKYPTPRRKADGHGFRFRAISTRVRTLNAKWAAVRLPKLGEVRFRITRPIQGEINSVSISCTAGQWFVSFASAWEAAASEPRREAVGIDRGVAISACLSTGEHFSAPDPRSAALARAQRCMARRKKGSARYRHQAARVASLRAVEGRRRKDWAHKATSAIADGFGVVVMENLKVKAMTASAAGSIDDPGKGVAQKRGLNRAILAQGWGIFAEQLAYKLEERGGALLFVEPHFTSQTCSACGVVDARSRKSQAVFECVACDHRDHADVNAAKEILRRGAPWLDVEAGVSRPLKRQSEALQLA